MPETQIARADPAKRAYARFELKSLSKDTGEFEGIASTPTVDRMEDVVEPDGAMFTLPIPLLWQHRASEPIGLITSATISKDGIAVKGTVAKDLLPRITEAWTLIKAGLVRGLSIGFDPKAFEPIKGTYGYRYTSWDWLELSCVTIPANAEANILTIKSNDDLQLRAASGESQRGVVRLKSAAAVAAQTVEPRTGVRIMSTKTISEQLASFEAKRAANMARMTEIMAKSGDEGRTLDETETQEYDGLQAEVKAVDEHLVRLRAHEASNKAAAVAVPATAGVDPDAAAKSRQGGVVVTGKSNLPQGTAFTRYAMCLMRSKGNLMQAAELAKQWHDTTPEVEIFLKAAVAAGTTTDATWAGPLVYATNMASEFVEFLRPMTIVGRINGLRRIPFNVRMPAATAGTVAGWVGQGAGKPVSKMDFGTTTLGFTKIAVIVAMTEELVRFSNPSAEAIVRGDMAAAIAQFMDQQFINPDVAAVGTTSPASITNGLTPVASTGSTIAQIDADIRGVFNKFITANVPLTNPVWIMNPRSALFLSTVRTANDIYVWPTITFTGGTFYGIPVITSNNVPIESDGTTAIILMDANEVFMADDGGVALDTSTEASIQMSDAPSAGAQSLVSLWQNNMVGIRAERFVNYKRRRDGGVALIAEVAY